MVQKLFPPFRSNTSMSKQASNGGGDPAIHSAGSPERPRTRMASLTAAFSTIHTHSDRRNSKKNERTRKTNKPKNFHFPLTCPTNNATKEERRCRCNWNCRRAHFLYYNHSTERHHEYHIVCAARFLTAASDCTCVERPQIWANSRTRARRRRCCRQNACHAAEYITVK